MIYVVYFFATDSFFEENDYEMFHKEEGDWQSFRNCNSLKIALFKFWKMASDWAYCKVSKAQKEYFKISKVMTFKTEEEFQEFRNNYWKKIAGKKNEKRI